MGTSEAATLLRRHGVKTTRQRKAILAVLTKAKLPLTVDVIHQKLRDNAAAVNPSTIYRVLTVLVHKGIAEQLLSANGKSAFVLATSGHTHHLSCTNCGRVARMSTCPLTPVLLQIASDNDFLVTGHRLELFGLCAACQTTSGSEARL